MSTRETTYLTGDEWRERVGAAAKAAEGLYGDIRARSASPGEAVIALIIAARAICYANKALPPFEWYAARLLEMSVEFDLATAKGRPQA